MPIKPLNLNIAIQRASTLSVKEKELTQKLLDAGYDFLPLIAESTSYYSPSSVDYWKQVMLDHPWINTRTYDFSKDDKFKSGPWLFDNVKNWIQSRKNINYEQWLIDELAKKGLKVQSTKELASSLSYKLKNGEDFYPELELLLSQLNFGNMRTEANDVLMNKANANALFNAVYALGYVIPETSDSVGLSKMKKIYWGVYYLRNFPIPKIESANCGQIEQTLIQLQAENANIKQSELDKLFSFYTQQDWDDRQQVISDLITKFNGIYARLNCTSAQVSQSSKTDNKLLKITLMVCAGVIASVILFRIFKKNKQP